MKWFFFFKLSLDFPSRWTARDQFFLDMKSLHIQTSKYLYKWNDPLTYQVAFININLQPFFHKYKKAFSIIYFKSFLKHQPQQIS